MTDELGIAYGQPDGTAYNGRTYGTIVVCVEADTADQARTRLHAFTEEVQELSEAHPGVSVVTDPRTIHDALQYGVQIIRALIREQTAERARRQ